MKEQNNTFSDHISKLFLSFFGTGLVPKAPGTMGSLATVPVLYGLYQLQLSLLTHIIIIIIVFTLGSLVTEYYQKKHNLHDPGWIVIDEVVGMYITWLAYPSDSPMNLAIIFILFRVFDILKPPPISYFDKKITNGFGVMIDDVIAALFSGTIYFFVASRFI